MRVDALLKRHLSSCLMAGLIFFAAAYLFMKNDRELDPDYQKNWWTISFAILPVPENPAFIIANHTKTEDFTYTITLGSETIETGEVSVPKGASRTIQPEYPSRASSETGIHAKRKINAWPSDSPQDSLSIYQK
ncbi:MAG: hypothetical protein KBB51_02395 [Candidatus Moranbacteria bacterium]|nr:hypothetical protein [Candidatus Moranbacteria bacterium]